MLSLSAGKGILSYGFHRAKIKTNFVEDVIIDDCVLTKSKQCKVS